MPLRMLLTKLQAVIAKDQEGDKCLPAADILYEVLYCNSFWPIASVTLILKF